MSDWVVAIPSYKRAQTLASKTLTYLKKTDVDPARVVVFVANEEEANDYRAAIGAEYKIVVGVPGMRAIRNFIQQYFSEGQEIFCLDDDLEGIFAKIDDKRTALVTDLKQMIDNGFQACKIAKAGLWGINAVHNPFFMKHTVSTDLKYIVGCVWGCVNSRNENVAVTLDDKEDFERTIKFYLRDGAVVRFNGYAPKTRYYKEPGGMQVERTKQRIEESAKILATRYPYLCSLNNKKADGNLEVRLRDKRISKSEK